MPAKSTCPSPSERNRPGPLDPGLVASVHALPRRRIKFRVLHMKHLDARMIEIDELQIVELLQHKMAGIEQHVAAGMVLHPLQEHFEGDAIVQVFSGMDFET